MEARSSLHTFDPATALVVIASSLQTPELALQFHAKKTGLVVEYTYFVGK